MRRQTVKGHDSWEMGNQRGPSWARIPGRGIGRGSSVVSQSSGDLLGAPGGQGTRGQRPWYREKLHRGRTPEVHRVSGVFS